jgi:hypothetical protein
MKCSEFAALLDKIEGVGRAYRAPSQAGVLPRLRALFEIAPSNALSVILKSLVSQQGVAVAQDPELSIDTALRVLKAGHGLLAPFGKPATAKDLDAVIAALEPHRDAELDELVAAISKQLSAPNSKSASTGSARQDVVRAWNKRLEEVLGDDEGFQQAYGALKQDKTINAAEVIAIAKVFAHATVKSRPAGLKKILSRHTNLMVSRAKEAATAGRVAG